LKNQIHWESGFSARQLVDIKTTTLTARLKYEPDNLELDATLLNLAC
jgi:hypothetical protein